MKTLLMIMVLLFAPVSIAANSIDLQQIIIGSSSGQSFSVPRVECVSWMDATVANYGYAPISQEPVAELRAIYAESAYLLRNGYPIAGGTLITIARNKKAFNKSDAGAGMAHFVDAMLQPTEEDDYELMDFLSKSAKAMKVIKKIPRSAVRMAASIYVVGGIYNDPIAVKAGQTALDKLQVTQTEQELISLAQKEGNRP